jgi:hypothetical protein
MTDRDTDRSQGCSFVETGSREREQTPRLPFETVTAMVVSMACAIEGRPQWAISPSSRNNATRSRRTPPRRGARLRQSPNKTVIVVPSSPWRRASSNFRMGAARSAGAPGVHYCPRNVGSSSLVSQARQKTNEMGTTVISTPVSWALSSDISRRRTKKRNILL